MKSWNRMMVAALTGVMVAGAARAAEDEAAELSAGLDVTVASGYLWRGQLLNDEAVAQPSLTVSKGGFSINWWGNNNLTDQITGDSAEFSEHDIGISYSTTCPLTGAGVTLGLVNYDFPNQALTDDEGAVNGLVADTAEAYLIYGFGDVLLAPTLTVYYDFKEADGFYGMFGISHSVEMCDYASISLGASIGFADSDWSSFYFPAEAGQDDTLVDGTVTLSVPMTLGDWTLTPAVQYATLVESDIEDSAESTYFNDGDVVVGSLKASYAF